MTDWTQRCRPLAVVGALALACAGCATEEELNFGDPARVTGGFPVSSTTGGSEPIECDVDNSCQVSWALQVYGDILDGPAACGETNCHAEGTGGLLFPRGDADGAYTALTDYRLAGAGDYVVPCNPAASGLICNAQLPEGVNNPFLGPAFPFDAACGSLMPRLKGDSPAQAITLEQLNVMATWINCGAPQN